MIKSAVVHYEIEMVHPFSDGNGRMGRLWQSVILITFESIFYDNQQDYYQMLSQSDRENSSTVFLEFMLEVILETLNDY